MCKNLNNFFLIFFNIYEYVIGYCCIIKYNNMMFTRIIIIYDIMLLSGTGALYGSVGLKVLFY